MACSHIIYLPRVLHKPVRNRNRTCEANYEVKKMRLDAKRTTILAGTILCLDGDSTNEIATHFNYASFVASMATCKALQKVLAKKFNKSKQLWLTDFHAAVTNGNLERVRFYIETHRFPSIGFEHAMEELEVEEGEAIEECDCPAEVGLAIEPEEGFEVEVEAEVEVDHV
jgi:hypothetical protein